MSQQQYNDIDFDTFQLIPTDEALKPPISDAPLLNTSKPIHKQQTVQKYVQNLGKQQVVQNAVKLKEIVTEMKIILNKPEIQDYNVINQAQKMQLLLQNKQKQVISLKQKLLESTQNNIKTIFEDFSFKQQQVIVQQLKQQIRKINVRANTVQNISIGCKHEDKLLLLIKNYEQMLQLYHKNQNSVHEINKKQQENYMYFSSINSQLKHQISYNNHNQNNNKFYDNKILSLQNKIKQLTDLLNNSPQRVKIDNDSEWKVKQFLSQIQILNERIIQRQIQVQKLRETNQQLMYKNREFQKYKNELEKYKQQQNKKDRRIVQLENAIIGHIQSRVKQDSMSSYDSDSQKNRTTIRNLKTLVNNLKEENRNLKQSILNSQIENQQLKKKLYNHTSDSSQKLQTIQKVKQDEPYQKIVLQILKNISPANECNCLQKIAYYLQGLNEQLPQIQQILQQAGLMHKSSEVIPPNI